MKVETSYSYSSVWTKERILSSSFRSSFHTNPTPPLEPHASETETAGVTFPCGLNLPSPLLHQLGGWSSVPLVPPNGPSLLQKGGGDEFIIKTQQGHAIYLPYNGERREGWRGEEELSGRMPRGGGQADFARVHGRLEEAARVTQGHPWVESYLREERGALPMPVSGSSLPNRPHREEVRRL